MRDINISSSEYVMMNLSGLIKFFWFISSIGGFELRIPIKYILSKGIWAFSNNSLLLFKFVIIFFSLLLLFASTKIYEFFGIVWKASPDLIEISSGLV